MSCNKTLTSVTVIERYSGFVTQSNGVDVWIDGYHIVAAGVSYYLDADVSVGIKSGILYLCDKCCSYVITISGTPYTEAEVRNIFGKYDLRINIPRPIVKMTSVGKPGDVGFNSKSVSLTVEDDDKLYRNFKPQYWMWIQRRERFRKRLGDNKTKSASNWRHKTHWDGSSRPNSKWYGGRPPLLTDENLQRTEWDVPVTDDGGLLLNCLTEDFNFAKFFRYRLNGVMPTMSDVVTGVDVISKGSRKANAFIKVRFTVTIEDEAFGDYPFLHSEPSDIIHIRNYIQRDINVNFYQRTGIRVI